MAIARPLLLALISAIPLLAQGNGAPDAAPAVKMLTRINGGLGGWLQFADGARSGFHVEVSATRARLCAARLPAGADDELAIGSAEEEALLGALERWACATYSTEEMALLQAPERLRSPRTEAEDEAHKNASLLRTVHDYRLATRPQVSRVFAGRGTVALSLQLALAGGAPRQILWRRLGDDSFARIHLGTEDAPVVMDSREERILMLALGTWLAANLGGRAALWLGEHADAPEAVRLVLSAFRGYLTATSPRLRTAGVIMDGNPGGSRAFTFSDAQNRAFEVTFDFRSGSSTMGRLRDGGSSLESPVVELGSARERELLGFLRRAAELRRTQLGAEGAAADPFLKALDEQLEAYARTFQVGNVGGKGR